MPRAVSTHNASAATRDAEFSSTIYNELTLFILQLVRGLLLATGVARQCAGVGYLVRDKSMLASG